MARGKGKEKPARVASGPAAPGFGALKIDKVGSFAGVLKSLDDQAAADVVAAWIAQAGPLDAKLEDWLRLASALPAGHSSRPVSPC